jgi:RNA polymerase sigma factor (sigma-70 family)
LGQSFDIHDYLVERCKSGDSIAQEEIYRRYAKNMYNTAFRILGHNAEAEDVLQESFLEVFTKISDYRGDSTFGAWLKRIVINRSISVLRRRKLELVDNSNFENIAEEDLEFEIKDVNEDMVKWVKRGIENLPDGYRIVLSLYLLEGYDHVEIAQILNISESTSKTQYSRAKAKLKKELIPIAIGIDN